MTLLALESFPHYMINQLIDTVVANLKENRIPLTMEQWVFNGFEDQICYFNVLSCDVVLKGNQIIHRYCLFVHIL
jgi:hypothetical protein